MTPEEKTKEKAKLTEWMAGVMGYEWFDDDLIIGWAKRLDNKTFSFVRPDFNPTEILEQALEGRDKFNNQQSKVLISLEDSGRSEAPYRIRVLCNDTLVLLSRENCTLKDLAYRIVKTLKEQSEVKDG